MTPNGPSLKVRSLFFFLTPVSLLKCTHLPEAKAVILPRGQFVCVWANTVQWASDVQVVFSNASWQAAEAFPCSSRKHSRIKSAGLWKDSH